ncbi:hypothetical protein [Rhizobium sp. L1K21]|uniref:hypothetical protein n=1 Tax=Rhizobium sp. L1K21 TaxID=2954933 RepID=UPI0020928493|nr:hypothetical protein [Rhizobium sp. L1K21]MCO6185498.1 hypothetical protein [Rhizobium sp. L1K21]
MIQIACVKWGTRYSAGEVNFMFDSIRKYATEEVRFCCITDDVDGQFDPQIRIERFPDFPQPMNVMTDGCVAKLAIYQKGLFEPGVPVIFFDLDTMIRGDVARLAKVVRKRRGINMMPNHHIQFWKIQNYVRPILRGKYYFANSSLMGFFPEDAWFVYDEMMRIYAEPMEVRPKKYASDERFVSSQATHLVKVFPDTLAVKFADEFIFTRWTFLEKLRNHVPWVARRRKGLVAVTFVSDSLKPQKVAALKKDDIVYYKDRPHVWRELEYSDYWRQALERGNAGA